MAVQKIPSNVQSLLNASARISNYKSAVEELVYNSLDAESSSIAIRIHIQRNWLQVVDNGNGIKNDDFKLLGERYATSKLMDIHNFKAAPTKFGYQGQSLANIIEVSETVKITSRCANSNETWLKTFLEGNESECRKVTIRPSKGTTVEIHGFLFNLNIQRKCVNPFTEVQNIKMFLEHLLLAFNNVSISLRDDSDNEILFKIHKNRDIYQTFKSLFDIDLNDIKELQVQRNEYKVKAFIGIKEMEIKKYQWIYLNNKFVHDSNLHGVVNCKLSKTLGLTRAKIKKNKIKVHFNEDDNGEHQSIPFYFIFITCPYYEYDIVYSGKQTTIEFKDWTEINKLIEKFVQFYNGDNNIKPKNTNNQIKKQVKSVDTKNEVKNIIEKFLGNYKNKNPRVSQMQNGVKGKDIKRKKKKDLPQISLGKEAKTPCKINNVHNRIKSPKIKNMKNTQINNQASKHYLKPTKQFGKNQTNTKLSKKSLKFAKRSLKCKCNKVDNLIELFKRNTDTIKTRCNKISSHLKDLMNLKYSKIDEPIMNQEIDVLSIRKETASENGNTTTGLKKTMKQKSSDILRDEHFNSYKRPIVEKPKSYDLLQTILKTPQDYNKVSEKEDTYIDVHQNSRFTSKFTYESHKYNMKHKKHLNLQTREQSRENLIRPANKICKSNFKTNTGKVTKRNQFKAKSLRKRDFSADYKILNKHKQNLLNTQFLIDTYGESDIIEISKKIRNQIVNDMKYLLDNNERYEIQSENKYIKQSNYEVNFKIESTYTILIDSIHNSSQIFNKYPYQNYFIEESAETRKSTNISYNDKTYSAHIEEEASSKNNDLTNNKLNVFIPESLNKSSECVEPLDLCEVIITNSDKLAEEFNDTFGINKNNDSLFMERCDEKIDINISENQNCDHLNENDINNRHLSTSLHKTLSKEYYLPLQQIDKNESRKINHTDIFDEELNNNEENFIETEACMLGDKSINDFELFSRHRFMPKGTSPIFNNVFSKNICSYNLDAEYYKDTIYDNFAKEVEINADIYEPKIQNIKDLTTGHIQKVTDKLQKFNAHLIFEAQSLANGKVLGQVDCKFIAAKILAQSQAHESSEFLVLFDQHAVHERIKLENNLEYYFNGNSWRSVTIEAISMKISKDEVLYLHNHKDKFTQCGLRWTAINNCEILVTAVPEAIVGKNRRPVDIILKAVRNLINEQINGIKCVKGNVSLYPKSIMNLVFTEACRYAIKFGDMLSKKNCQDLIFELAKCKTPFQCAHGRPVMAVMMELQSNSNKYEFDMQKLMQFKNQIK